ncbi:hypothetical protein B0H13DRAFT_1865252 [Mycena leptocephala]|nr:hypothetical protein B0H13DRAFT_1865252 [Mycena leptocephala]
MYIRGTHPATERPGAGPTEALRPTHVWGRPGCTMTGETSRPASFNSCELGKLEWQPAYVDAARFPLNPGDATVGPCRSWGVRAGREFVPAAMLQAGTRRAAWNELATQLCIIYNSPPHIAPFVDMLGIGAKMRPASRRAFNYLIVIVIRWTPPLTTGSLLSATPLYWWPLRTQTGNGDIWVTYLDLQSNFTPFTGRIQYLGRRGAKADLVEVESDG